jgi:uncharacterized SAM-binding protein YcdF (DUF218 family)
MYHLITGLLQPTLLCSLLSIAALAWLWRKRRESRRRLLCLTVPFAALMVLCVPAVGYLALGTLEWSYPPLERRPDDTEAIVVLSGYVAPPGGARLQPEMGEDTVQRCLKAAELYHQGRPCPVLVSGGKVHPDTPGPTLAEVMRDFLLRLGVKPSDVIVEDQSRTTYENAVESCRLLRERGLTRTVLVTDAIHLGRALGCFRKQGFEPVPCGCRYRATAFRTTLGQFLPNPASARGCAEACHEWFGTIWYRLCGRI